MHIRREINEFASEDDKPILHWLFDHYSMQSQWSFVARCTFDRYGTRSYEVNRIWTPTKEGLALYAQLAISTKRTGSAA